MGHPATDAAHLQAREARPEDYEACVRLVPLLESGDPIPSFEAWQSNQLPDSLVLESEGAVVGLAWTRIYGAWAHVVHVIVDAAWQGRGVGRRLLEELAVRLRAAGCDRWYLNVKRNNVPALRLYASMGFEAPVETTALWLPWAMLPALRLPADPPTARPVEPEEDEEIERRYDLVPGSLAGARRRNEVAIRIGDAAFALFNPAFPGSPCFRVSSPDLVRTLLLGLRPYVRESDERIMLVVQDPGVEPLLRAHGAEVKMELYRLRGIIPCVAPLARGV